MRYIRICAVVLILAISCSAEGSDAIAVGVRAGQQPFAIVDNCPAVLDVAIEVDGQVQWAIRRVSAAPDIATLDVPLGTTPEGWEEVTPFPAGFQDGVVYDLQVGPSEANLEFRLTDLTPGQAYDGQSSTIIGTRSELVTCDEVDDGGIDSFGEFLFTAAVLLILAFGVIGIVAWLLVKGLRRLVDRRAGDRLANEPPDDQWVDRD
ncbi:MAG: hypothetical protein ACR2QE_07680 [Acidimicrobiales bacterium]